MTDEMTVVAETAEEAVVSRVYEVGYHISPVVKEEDLDKVVSSIRSIIEKNGGSFIAEGAPAMTRLAYEMHVREGEKNIPFDRGYFGWIKFEAIIAAAQALEAALKADKNFLRAIVFRTVREDTRAKYKAPQLREVKRTDTIKAAPRHIPTESREKAPISEEKLDKALEELTV